MKKNKSGFTLFELLISISIIGILTALASVAYSGAQKKARDARRIEDIKSIQTAAEQYYSLNNYAYPAANLYSAGQSWGIGGTNILENYPSDPKGSGYGTYKCATGASCNPSGYCICALMENSTNANADVLNCNFTAATKNSFCAKNQQ
jgi:prepilin-type N-terminal cleavage/methylation domain-containing protein